MTAAPDPRVSRVKETLAKWLERSGLKTRVAPLLARYRSMDADKKEQTLTGLAFAAVAANILLVMAPLLSGFIDMNQKVQKITSEVQIAIADIGAEKQMTAALAEADQAIKETERRTFKSDEIHQFLDVLSAMAKDSKVKIESLKPVQVKTDADAMPRPLPKGYALAGFELSGKAGYHEFGDFVSRLESGVPFVKIESLEIYHDIADSRRIHFVKLRFLLIRRDK